MQHFPERLPSLIVVSIVLDTVQRRLVPLQDQLRTTDELLTVEMTVGVEGFLQVGFRVRRGDGSNRGDVLPRIETYLLIALQENDDLVEDARSALSVALVELGVERRGVDLRNGLEIVDRRSAESADGDAVVRRVFVVRGTSRSPLQEAGIERSSRSKDHDDEEKNSARHVS